MNTRNHRCRPQRNRGVALITALLVLAIATTAAAYLVRQEHLSIRRASNVINGNEAYLAALQGEAMAITLLHDDRKDNKIDTLLEEWAKQHPPFPLEGGRGYIVGSVTDLQGRFNVNNLVQGGKINGTAQARFQRLLAQFGIEPDVANAVVDWIDPDINTSGPYGAEDNYYLGLPAPYRAANSPLTDLSELRLIRGLREVPAVQFNQLLQQLTALRQSTPINVNTASEYVWMATDLSATQAAAVTRRPELPDEEDGSQEENGQNRQRQPSPGQPGQRQQQPGQQQRGQPQDPEAATQPFETVEQALIAAGVNNNEKYDKSNFSVASSYFLVEIEARVGNGRAVLKSVLYRNDKGMMQVVSRSQGDF